MEPIFTYPYRLPVARLVTFEAIEADTPDVLKAKLPEKIAKIVASALKSVTTEAPISIKTANWDITAFSENGVKRAFATERKKSLTTLVEGFSCNRSLMVEVNSDASLRTEEVGCYSQEKSSSKVMQQRVTRMLSIMQRFQNNPSFATTYAYVDDGSHVRFFQERPEFNIHDLFAKDKRLDTQPEKDKLAIAQGIALAIDSLAQAGFTHRALSFETVLLWRIDGKIKVKLTNLTHACSHGDWDAREEMVGNASFAAPESIQFITAQGKYKLSKEKMSQNGALYSRSLEDGTFHPVDFMHNLLGSLTKLLPDSAVDVWSLALIIKCFTQEKLTTIHSALTKFAHTKQAVTLTMESLAICTKKTVTESEKKALTTYLERLSQYPFIRSVGPLRDTSLVLQLPLLLKTTQALCDMAIENFEKELPNLPIAPKELKTLADIAQANMQLDSTKRLSTRQTLDALLAIEMQGLGV